MEIKISIKTKLCYEKIRRTKLKLREIKNEIVKKNKPKKLSLIKTNWENRKNII